MKSVEGYTPQDLVDPDNYDQYDKSVTKTGRNCDISARKGV